MKVLRRLMRDRQLDAAERAEPNLVMAVLVDNGTSLREAERADSVSKSSIQGCSCPTCPMKLTLGCPRLRRRMPKTAWPSRPTWIAGSHRRAQRPVRLEC